MEEKHELHFDRIIDLRSGDVRCNSTYDEKGGQCGRILCRQQGYRLGSVCAEHSGHMDMGASAVHINRERIYQGLCRALLVPGAECTLLDTIYSLCKKDKEGDAAGDHPVRLYVWKIQVQGGEERLPVSAGGAVGVVYRRAAAGGQQDIKYAHWDSVYCHDVDHGGDCVFLLPVFRDKGLDIDRRHPDGVYAGRQHWFCDL